MSSSENKKPGFILALVACATGALGIVTPLVGSFFVALTLVLALIATIITLKHKYWPGFGFSVLAWVLMLAGIATSPILLGIIGVSTGQIEPTAVTTPVAPDQTSQPAADPAAAAPATAPVSETPAAPSVAAPAAPTETPPTVAAPAPTPTAAPPASATPGAPPALSPAAAPAPSAPAPAPASAPPAPVNPSTQQ